MGEPAATADTYDVLFVGGGLTAVLASLTLLARRPGVRIAVVEQAPRLGGNHTWCFHAADMPPAAASIVAPLVVQRWPGYAVRFPDRSRRVASPYACISSERLHEVGSAALSRAPGCQLFLQQRVEQLAAQHVTLADGRTLHAALVVDARGPTLARDLEGEPGAQRGYQKFVGLELRVARHDLLEPVMFDARIAQQDGFRFMYVLPLAPDRVLIEETFFSDRSQLDDAHCRRAILDYAREQGLSVLEVVRTERGVLPMPWRERAFDPHARPLQAGYRAGLFHPVTGYSLPLAVRFALALASSSTPEPALAAFARAHAAQRPFLRLLTRLLFTGFAPAQRFRVLEHFYRLPEPVIERFYAAELTALDRARVFLGAPPRGFSVGRVLGLLAGASS
jgi:lycopene beta-cyclase